MRPTPPPVVQGVTYVRHVSSMLQWPGGLHREGLNGGWTLVTRRFGLWMSCTLVTGGAVASLGAVWIYLMEQVREATTAAEIGLQIIQGFGLGFLDVVIAATLCLGMVHIAKEQASGNPVRFRMLFVGFPRIWDIALTLLLCAIIVGAGSTLILPGIWLAGTLTFALPLVVEKEMGPFQAISESFRVLKRHAWDLAVFWICSAAILALSSFCGGIGVLFALPSLLATIGLHYANFYPPTQLSYDRGTS